MTFLERKPASSWVLAAAMVLAAVAAAVLMPSKSARPQPRLAQVVPQKFADWSEIEAPGSQVDPAVDNEYLRNGRSPYDEILMRAYRNKRGDVIYLALAYGGTQRQELKIHRPDLCYVAQGFQIVNSKPAIFHLFDRADASVKGTRMLVRGQDRAEAVSYWIRIGSIYSLSAWDTRIQILARGVRGKFVDGILVRVSQVVAESDPGLEVRFQLQEKFLSDLLEAMTPETRRLLVVRS